MLAGILVELLVLQYSITIAKHEPSYLVSIPPTSTDMTYKNTLRYKIKCRANKLSTI